MAYDLTRIADEVQQHLHRTPRMTASRLARLLGVDRHTIAKAVKKSYGCTFTQLQDQWVGQLAGSLHDNQRVLSLKECATALGYASVRSAQRRSIRLLGRSLAELRAGRDRR